MEIKVLENLLNANETIALKLRQQYDSFGLVAFNIMGSPGSGKTALLEQTLKHLHGKFQVGVIEGDVSTTLDAQRLAPFNIPVLQITTESFGGQCHLAANMIESALDKFSLKGLDFFIIENVGNLICPTGYNLGEHYRVVVVSLPEGEEKPLKYPGAFRKANVVVITKIDLEGMCGATVAQMEKNCRLMAPQARIFTLSNRTGTGLNEWVNWLSSLPSKQ